MSHFLREYNNYLCNCLVYGYQKRYTGYSTLHEDVCSLCVNYIHVPCSMEKWEKYPINRLEMDKIHHIFLYQAIEPEFFIAQNRVYYRPAKPDYGWRGFDTYEVSPEPLQSLDYDPFFDDEEWIEFERDNDDQTQQKFWNASGYGDIDSIDIPVKPPDGIIFKDETIRRWNILRWIKVGYPRWHYSMQQMKDEYMLQIIKVFVNFETATRGGSKYTYYDKYWEIVIEHGREWLSLKCKYMDELIDLYVKYHQASNKSMNAKWTDNDQERMSKIIQKIAMEYEEDVTDLMTNLDCLLEFVRVRYKMKR